MDKYGILSRSNLDNQPTAMEAEMLRILKRIDFKSVLKKLAVLAGFMVLIMTVGHCMAKRSINKEWEEKVSKKRTPEEVRGLLDSIVKHRRMNVPAFVPQNMWHREMCAAAIVNAVNFFLGEERLKMSAAWNFYQANKEQLELVYKRTEDFKIVGNQIIETYDRPFYLSEILKSDGEKRNLTSNRLYVIGYHYHETRSDESIIRSLNNGGTMNSHLMLVLGRYDGFWWGYHMLHHVKQPKAVPFRIDNLSGMMPQWFDAMYIWEVKNTDLPAKWSGARVALVHHTPDYEQITSLLGWGGRNKFGFFLDSVLTYFFGSTGEQFPRVVDLRVPVVSTGPTESLKNRRGDIVGFYKGVAVVRNGGTSQRGTFGLEYECVEFINRFLYSLGHKNLTQMGNADSYFHDARGKGLFPYKNGSAAPPQPDDIIVFDKDGLGGTPGHAAVVTTVDMGRVCMIQQNTDVTEQCLPLAYKQGGWHVGSFTKDLPCVGWSRRRQ